jgi:large subunit ribosomal protein L10
MNRAEKEAEVAFLREALQRVESVVLASVKGLNMTQVTDLRRRLQQAGVKMRVVKNTLAKKAIEGSDLAALQGDFKGETAIVWSNDDAVSPAKVTQSFKKDCEKFAIKAGFTGGQRLDQAGVETLSKLPSLDELRAQLLGTIKAVPAKLLAQVQAPAQQIVGVLQAKVDKEKEAA